MRLGVRELRTNLAALVRRAEAGQRIVITVAGRPVAQLGPMEPGRATTVTLGDLAAAGLVVAARRDDRPGPDLVVPLPVGTRIDRLVAEVRGVTLFLDSSALLARYLGGPTRAPITEAMAADGDWCASELALGECLVLIERLSELESERGSLRAALHDDWERVCVVPVDRRCLDRATDLGRAHPVRTVDALILAAADRLPRPLTYATFDARQIPVALALGFSVVST